MTEPIDQATKDLIEKDAEEYGYSHESERGYVDGATVWAEKLKRERELRKELVDGLSNIEFDIKSDVRSYTLTSHTETLFNALKKIESLIQKAKRQKS